MKILCLSDLHLDHNERRLQTKLVQTLADFINQTGVDIFLVAGDVAGTTRVGVNYLLNLQEKITAKILAVPGNHDCWTNTDSSWNEYNLFAKQSFSLINNPYVTGNIAIIGDLGWYDYAYGVGGYTKAHYASWKDKQWVDGIYANWGMSDIELVEVMVQKLEKQILEHQDKEIVFVCHTVPFKEFVHYKANDNEWNFCCAYFGCGALNKLILKYQNIKTVVFGHTHFPSIQTLSNKKAICNPLGYVFEWGNQTDFAAELESKKIILSL